MPAVEILIGLAIFYAIVVLICCVVRTGPTAIIKAGDAIYDPLVDARKHLGLWRESAICNARCGVVASIPVTKLRIFARPFQRNLPSVRRTLARHFPNSRSNAWTVYRLYCIGKVDCASPLRSSAA